MAQRGGYFRMAGPHLSPRVTVLLASVLLFIGTVSCVTRQSDINALNSLYQAWSSPGDLQRWGSGDPCTVPWYGVTCDGSNSTVTNLYIPNTNLAGTISADIGDLSGLTNLDFSGNSGLTGPLPSQIGQLSNLQTLSIQYCQLTGALPTQLGNLLQLTFIGLNGNNLTGPLPASLGNLANLFWFDVSNNFINGDIPVSGPNTVGLDSITDIQHLHLNNNSFTGPVPQAFLSLPRVLHVLLHYNNLSGTLPIPSGNWSTTLQVIRVDYNEHLFGTVNQTYAEVPDLQELSLKGNHFSGPVPDFSNATKLQLLDLSDNSFDSELSFPSWASLLTGISTLNLAGMSISGSIPSELFALPNLQSVDLSNNQLTGSLDFNTSFSRTSPTLLSINLQNNNISGFIGQPTVSNASWNLTISLQNNPICHNQFVSLPSACLGPGGAVFIHPPVQTNCSGESLNSCDSSKILNWYTCSCSYPLALELILTAPTFSNLDEEAPRLESNLSSQLPGSLKPEQVFVWNMVYTQALTVEAFIYVFPATGDMLSQYQSDSITQALRQHTFSIAEGPYLLYSDTQSGSTSKKSLSTGAIIGIAIGSLAGVFVVLFSILFAVYHKRRADRAVMSNPFASWGGGSAEFGEAPKLKGARWFSLAELKQYTDNWSDDNMIGVGGYGKVYRGELPDGTLVAIKRATEGSMQGANEFKNEIELLSRVHHRNLLGLVGFCYEGGEQALIYEFMPNGTLSDHLTAREVPLTWDQRLEIALASAIGINYLHDHASPPIIHRDIKSANILLNEKMVAKVADFGLSKLAPDEGEKLVHSVNVKGTMGYLDPEYYMTSDLTDKSDVYSFGIVLLELLTSKPPIDQGRFVVREFRNALDRGGIEALRPLLDPALQNISVNDLEPYLKIAMSCVEEDGASRPTTAEIVKQLQALDMLTKPKGGVRSMDVESGGKKVKFADEFNPESEQMDLLGQELKPTAPYPYEAAPDSFRYSGAYGVSTTVKPK